jgi:hypothetical protein
MSYHQVQSLLYRVIIEHLGSDQIKIKLRFVVQVSFDLAEYTAEVDGVGTLRLLDAIRTCGLSDSVRFYQVLIYPKLDPNPCINIQQVRKLRKTLISPLFVTS